MDKLLFISCILFLVADIFTLTSLFHPAWIISRVVDSPGAIVLGLVSQCLTIWGREPVCRALSLPPEWSWCLFFIVSAIVCLSLTCVLLLLSDRRSVALLYARWMAFIGLICMCLAAVIFPAGFYIKEIGGEPFRLPSSFRVGPSYILFFFAILLTLVSELFAERICQPFL